MQTTVINRRSVRAALLAGAALGVLSVPTGFAQAQELEEIVVTGSRIASPNLVATSPVTTVGAEEFTFQGTTRVEDLVNNLPQAFASQGGSVSNGSTGTATVDLRGLGATRTLVLVDGRRLPAGSPGAGGTAPDLNQIPGSLVERVEIVTGGASAVYGSDAVSGVVNFIMKDDFEGVMVDAQYSFYQHHNDNSAADVVSGAGFPLPDDNVLDGFMKDITAVVGVNSADGRGNVTMYAGYREIDALLQSERDFSACAIGVDADENVFTCSGSSTSFPGRFFINSGPAAAAGNDDLTVDQATGAFRAFAASDIYNFGPLNYFQRPDERITLGAFGRYEITPEIEAYAQLMFMNNQTVAQIAPSGLFGVNVDLSCDNPMLSAAQRATLCGANPAAGDTVNIDILRRNVEGGGRQDDLQHTSYRLTGGLRGQLTGGWDWDVYGQYSRVNFAETYLNDFSISRGTLALDAVLDPATGNIVCRSALAGTNPDCVPYNIFTPGGVTQEALNYLQTPGFQRGYTEQSIVSGSITGDLGQYGLTSPLALTGVGIALGAEYRDEVLVRRVDTAFATGDLAGQGGPTLGVEGGFDVTDFFGELRVPLVEGKPFAEQLTLDLGYRYSDYSTAGSTDTYKIAGDWAPVQDLRIRASYNRAVRAPNVQELFVPQGIGLWSGEDPCAGDTPEFTAAQCALTGVTAAQYGSIRENTADQYNQLGGGNPNLAPESSDTYSVGFVLTPEVLPGFSLTVDWFQISIDDAISTVPPEEAIRQCGLTGDAAFCDLINRDPTNGSLWISQDGYVIATNVNIATLETRGVDVEANYTFDLADVGSDLGSVNFSILGTWLDSLALTPLPGADEIECVGFHGSSCGVPTPEWRHRLRTTWSTPWDLDLSLSWRYIDAVDLLTTTAPINQTLDAQNYFDLAAVYQLKEGIVLNGGINNIFDNDPPISASTPAGFGNGNTYPQVYDTLGRYVFLGASFQF